MPVVVGVLGQEWGAADLHTRTPYKAFSSHEIEADVGMKIGLASVNITLKSMYLNVVKFIKLSLFLIYVATGLLQRF